MYKTILFLLLIMVNGTYHRIKKFRVTDVVDDFLIRNDIINCFKKEEDEALFLKCWRNNELVNVEIFIEPYLKKSWLSLSSLCMPPASKLTRRRHRRGCRHRPPRNWSRRCCRLTQYRL